MYRGYSDLVLIRPPAELMARTNWNQVPTSWCDGVTRLESWLDLGRGWLIRCFSKFIPTVPVIPSSGDNDKRHQFIEYSLCLHHSPRYHGVRPPDSRRWQWENDRSKSFVFPQIELLPPTTDRESRAAFLPPKIQLGAEKTFNVMMTATGKHHSRVINSWIWRATVFSWLAPVEWDIVGHLIRAEPVDCGGERSRRIRNRQPA